MFKKKVVLWLCLKVQEPSAEYIVLPNNVN